MVRTEDACEIIKYALQNEIKVYLDGWKMVQQHIFLTVLYLGEWGLTG